jgi:hypothetical protein
MTLQLRDRILTMREESSADILRSISQEIRRGSVPNGVEVIFEWRKDGVVIAAPAQEADSTSRGGIP